MKRVLITAMGIMLLAIVSTSRSADDASVLLSDDFATLDPAWGESDAYMSVSGNKLNLAPRAGKSYSTFYQGNLFDDADITVKVSLTSGGTDEDAGIVFWGTDLSNYYCACVSPDGRVGVMRNEKGTWLYPLQGKVFDAVIKGVGQTNELRVVTKGKTATVYVNGTQVVSLKGFPPANGSQIGLHAESGDSAPYTWAFSDFVVRKPQ
jgi:hypothetical protein